MSRPPLRGSGFLNSNPFGDRGEAVQKEIARRVGAVSFPAIENAASWYLLARASDRNAAPLRELRRRASRLKVSVAKLHDDLAQIMAMSRGYHIDNGSDHLSALCGLAVDALKFELSIPKGRPVMPVTVLVSEIAAIIGSAGLPLSRKPNGPLHQCLYIVFDELGEQRADLGKLIGDAMGRRRWTNPPRPQPELSEEN